MNNLTSEFELKCKRLIGHEIINVYYQYDVEDFKNFRKNKTSTMDFEYIPLANMYLKMEDNTYFHFSDSNKFSEYYYTIDIDIITTNNYQIENDMTSDHQWVGLVGNKITNTIVNWGTLKNITLDQEVDIYYPKYVEVIFSNNRTLLIVSGEIEIENDRFKFIIPDESLILFFTKKAYEEKHIVLPNS